MVSVLLILFLWLVPSAQSAPLQDKAFERIWSESKENIYPENLVPKYFSKSRKAELKKSLKRVKTWSDLEEVVNPFLLSLGVSHTKLYSKESLEYYFFRSLFSTKSLQKPKVRHIGMQVGKINSKYYIRALLEGYPAKEAGLSRGDLLIEVNGKPFHPYHSFNSGSGSYKIVYSRKGIRNKISVNPVFESIHLSFVKATRNSVRIIKIKNKKIGYIHLWSGTHGDALKTLISSMKNELKKTDGLILDLRDGFGGAWWDYLDPFFPNRKDYFRSSLKNRTGKKIEMSPPQKENKGYYSKPMVVISNEGVRSGKEALVYQFKKTKRAIVVGKNTGGMFSMGKGVFSDKDLGFILYLSVGELFLDGHKVEGVGVSPNIEVDYKVTQYKEVDPQFDSAQKELLKLL